MENRLIAFVRNVGTGPKGARPLRYEEAYEAMVCLLEGAFDPVTFGAFAIGMRWKGETPEELAGFADALRQRGVRPVPVQVEGLVDCAGNFDGKNESVNVGLAASVVAAAAGVPILLHGAEGVPVTDGVTHAHVLRALGIDPELPPEGVAACVGRVGIGFAHQKVVAPALWALLPLRRAVGKRTFLNTVEPLANPGRAAVHVGSCFHLPYASRVCEALARCRAADWPPTARAVVFQGVEGADELRPGQARLAELRGEEVATATVDARAAGVAFDLRDLALPGGDAAASARWTEALLTEGDAAAAGAPPAAAGAFREAVLWSAAVRIYAAGRAPDLAAALRPAREALASGEAGRVLAAWRAAAPLAAAGAWAAGRSASPA